MEVLGSCFTFVDRSRHSNATSFEAKPLDHLYRDDRSVRSRVQRLLQRRCPLSFLTTVLRGMWQAAHGPLWCASPPPITNLQKGCIPTCLCAVYSTFKYKGVRLGYRDSAARPRRTVFIRRGNDIKRIGERIPISCHSFRSPHHTSRSRACNLSSFKYLSPTSINCIAVKLILIARDHACAL